MSNIRLVIVVRKDLQMPAGLLAAQVLHAGDQFMRLKINNTHPDTKFSDMEKEWCKSPYVSVLAVQTLEELDMIQDKAQEERLPMYSWVDLVPSPTFKDQSFKARVAIAIGPEDFDKIKLVTGQLPLY